MLRITSPRPIRGRRTFLGVEFVDGFARVESLHPERELALTQHGYTVTEIIEPTPFLNLTVKELRELASIEGLDIPAGARKPEIVAAFIRAGVESD